MNKEKVGYQNPPAKTRYKKGVSGNPRGRPKGTKNFKTDFNEELSEEILIREGEKTVSVSKQRAMIKNVMNQALKGNIKAIQIVIMQLIRLLDKETPEEISEDLNVDDKKILSKFKNSQSGKKHRAKNSNKRIRRGS